VLLKNYEKIRRKDFSFSAPLIPSVMVYGEIYFDFDQSRFSYNNSRIRISLCLLVMLVFLLKSNIYISTIKSVTKLLV
jgi:hypothetical protein